MTPLDTTPRLSCLLTEINITGLLRKDLGDLDELCQSIRDNLDAGLPALIHPIVLSNDMRLLSGFRRYKAHEKLGIKEIDYAIYSVLDEAQRIRIEVDANKQKNFAWQERCLGIEKYHKYYQTSANLKGEAWGVRETGKLLNLTHNPVSRAIIICEYLHANDKDVWAAETMADAFKVLIRREEEHHTRLLVAQTLPKPGAVPLAPPKKVPSIADEDFFDLDTPQGGFIPGISGPITTDERPGAPKAAGAGPVIPLSTMLLKEDNALSLSVLDSLGANSCDHIVTDPPYGVEDHIETINQSDHFASAADVAGEHIASETAAMMTRFYPLAVRALRDRGFIIMWCDPVFWWQHCCEFEKLGLAVQRWPLVWVKTSQCINTAAQYNWTKTVEFAVVARKKSATLLTPQRSCCWTGGSDIETKLIGHPFAKPFGLWKWCYDAIAQRGAEVLDPFVGKGSSVLPAIDAGLRFKGIECSDIHYNGLIYNVQQKYKSMDPGCTFS